MNNKQINRLQTAVGWFGASMLVSAYALLTFELVDAKSVVFNSMQLLGGLSIAYRVYLDRNWSNFTLEVFFISVALYALSQTSGLL